MYFSAESGNIMEKVVKDVLEDVILKLRKEKVREPIKETSFLKQRAHIVYFGLISDFKNTNIY